MIRGAAYRIDLGRPRGHEQGGKSPRSGRVPFRLAALSRGRRSHVDLGRPVLTPPELDITGRPTRMLVDQIRWIDVAYIVGDPVDSLPRDQLAEIELALVHYLGSHDVPAQPTS